MGRNIKLVLAALPQCWAQGVLAAANPTWGPSAPPAPHLGVLGPCPHLPVEFGVTLLPWAVSKGKGQFLMLKKADVQPLPSPFYTIYQ